MRIAFMGTPPFAVPTLAALHAAGHDIAAFYTQPARPAQRGKKIQQSAVNDWAETHALPVRTPKSLKGADEQAEFAALDLDIAVVAAYGGARRGDDRWVRSARNAIVIVFPLVALACGLIIAGTRQLSMEEAVADTISRAAEVLAGRA